MSISRDCNSKTPAMRAITSGTFSFQERGLSRLSKKVGISQCVQNAIAIDSFEAKFSVKTFYNVSSLAEADVYLLGEFHGGKKSNPTNGELISFLASAHPIVLFLELYELFTEVLDESMISKIMDKLRIDPAVRKNIRFFGWNVKMDPKIQRILDVLAFLRNCMEIDNQTLEIAINSNFKDLMVQPWLSSIGQQEKMALVLNEVEERIVRNNNKRNELNLLLMSELEKRFPSQTESMVSALQSVKRFGAKAIFQCGSSHLYELNSAFNLNPLRNELNNHKAVTLIPNDIDKFEDLSLAEKTQLIQAGKLPSTYC